MQATPAGRTNPLDVSTPRAIIVPQHYPIETKPHTRSVHFFVSTKTAFSLISRSFPRSHLSEPSAPLPMRRRQSPRHALCVLLLAFAYEFASAPRGQSYGSPGFAQALLFPAASAASWDSIQEALLIFDDNGGITGDEEFQRRSTLRTANIHSDRRQHHHHQQQFDVANAVASNNANVNVNDAVFRRLLADDDARRRRLGHDQKHERRCTQPPSSNDLPHLSAGSCNNTASGSFCRYTCAEGYEASRTAGYVACCDGSWLVPAGAKCTNTHAPKLLQFNVDEGGGSRLLDILTWVRDQRAGVAGFCELNGWTPASMQQHANLSGFEYSHLFQVPSGYHLGFMAAKPIRVITEQSTGFERGMLHVQVANGHYVVVHLHAHSAQKRIDEARLVAAAVQDVLREVGRSSLPLTR